jgi:hypothetical protein
VRHGFYKRQVIVLLAVLEILVVRYRCRGKGKVPPAAHRTFSLLPVESHPYWRYSSESVFVILKQTLQTSLTATMDFFGETFGGLSLSTLYRMKKLFEVAYFRLVSAGMLQSSATGSSWQPCMIACIESYDGKLLSLKKNFHDRFDRFLLGNPSQFRCIRQV